MNPLRTILVAGTFGGTVLGCSDSTGPELADIAGAWHATRIQVTNKANSAETMDLTLSGVTITINFNADLTYSTTFTAPGEAPDMSSGTYVQTATTLTLTESGVGGEVDSFTYTKTDANLTVSGGSINFDFGAGEVPARLDLTLVH